MITDSQIKALVEECLGNGPVFPVTVTVRKGNLIQVLLDGDAGVIVDDCVRVSRFIEGRLNREEEDFELEVASFGIGTPLVLPRQFRINIGRQAKATLHDQQVVTGELVAAGEDTFTLAVKVPPKKKVTENRELAYKDCLKVQIIVTFK